MSTEVATYSLQRLEIGADLLSAVAEAYCPIWQESPWNEQFRPDEVLRDLLSDLSRPGAIGWAATIKGIPAGFTWGYDISPEELEVLAGSSTIRSQFSPGKKLFYIAELGVVSDFRQMKLGHMLSSVLITEAQNRSIDYLVLRTDQAAIPARKLYAKLGFIESDVHDANHPSRTYWIKTL